MCQGKMLKAAGLRSLSMCAAGTQRTHLGGRCHLYKLQLGSLTCVMCSCGAVSIWASGVEMTAPPSFSTLWMVFDETDMNALQQQVCLTVSLPLPRSMTTSPATANLQQYQLADQLAVLLNEAMQGAKSMADIRAHLRLMFDSMGRPYGSE